MSTPTSQPPAAPPPGRPSDSTPSSTAALARPADGHPVPVTLADGLVLVAWGILGQVVIGALVGTALALTGVDTTQFASGPSLGALLVVIQSGTLAGALAWLAGRGRLKWSLLGPVRPHLRHVAFGVGWGVLALGAASLIGLIGQSLTGSTDGSGQSLLDAEALSGVAFLLTFAVAGILAPVAEELTFRGVLFQSIGKHVGWVPALLLSSAMFAVVHVEVLLSGGNALVFLVSLFTVGVVFGLAFHRSRSLVTAMVAHATFNGLQLLLARAFVLG